MAYFNRLLATFLVDAFLVEALLVIARPSHPARGFLGARGPSPASGEGMKAV